MSRSFSQVSQDIQVAEAEAEQLRARLAEAENAIRLMKSRQGEVSLHLAALGEELALIARMPAHHEP